MKKEHYFKLQPGSTVSPVVGFGDLIFVSGQVSVDRLSGDVIGSDIASQVDGAMANLSAFLEAAGSSIDKLLSMTVFIKNSEDFTKMNEAFSKWVSMNPPVRTTVRADMIFPEFLIEISAIANK